MLRPTVRVGNSDRLLGSPSPAPEGFVVINMGTNACFRSTSGVWASGSMPSIVAAIWGLESGQVPGDYTYYIDPVDGSDSADGMFESSPWHTTAHSDLVTLSGVETIGYKLNGTWYLYRSLGMTADQAELTADLVTATADQF